MREPRIPLLPTYSYPCALRPFRIPDECIRKARKHGLGADEPSGWALNYESKLFEERQRRWARCGQDVCEAVEEEGRWRTMGLGRPSSIFAGRVA